MMQENLGLILPKRVETKIPWTHILCTNEIIEHVTVSLKTIDYLFPLYLYPDTNRKDLFSHKKVNKKQPNISATLFTALAEVYKKDSTPETLSIISMQSFIQISTERNMQSFLGWIFQEFHLRKATRYFAKWVNLERSLWICICLIQGD